MGQVYCPFHSHQRRNSQGQSTIFKRQTFTFILSVSPSSIPSMIQPSGCLSQDFVSISKLFQTFIFIFLSLPSLTHWPLSLNLGAGKSQWWWISTSTRWDLVQRKFSHFLLVNIAENPENISYMFWSILLEIQKLSPVCCCQYCWDPR